MMRLSACFPCYEEESGAEPLFAHLEDKITALPPEQAPVVDMAFRKQSGDVKITVDLAIWHLTALHPYLVEATLCQSHLSSASSTVVAFTRRSEYEGRRCSWFACCRSERRTKEARACHLRSESSLGRAFIRVD